MLDDHSAGKDDKCPVCGQFYQFGNIDKTVDPYTFENPLPRLQILKTRVQFLSFLPAS